MRRPRPWADVIRRSSLAIATKIEERIEAIEKQRNLRMIANSRLYVDLDLKNNRAVHFLGNSRAEICPVQFQLNLNLVVLVLHRSK